LHSAKSGVYFTKTKTVNAQETAHQKMVIFNCTCGEKILVVPDLEAMNRAVKKHLIKHKNAGDNDLTEQTSLKKS
jgi:hypothetical protein